MGMLKRKRKKIKKWCVGYIDFSYLSIEGYQYIKSTYRQGVVSAVITQENIEIITGLIPFFNQNESLFFRFCRFFFDRKGRDKEFQSSFLFKLYCNGFTRGYKELDKKIRDSTDKLIFPSIKACKVALDEYIEELEDRDNCPTKETKGGTLFTDYLIDLGEQEGATVRFLEYKQKYEERIEEKDEVNIVLRDLLINLNEQEKDIILEKINIYLRQKNRRGKAIALLIKALQMNNYLLESDKRISLYSAIDKLVNYDTGTRGGKDQYLRSTSIFDIEKEARELSKVIRVNRNEPN